MTDGGILRPDDLTAEELVQLHADLGGDPASAAHREHWDKSRLAGLSDEAAARAAEWRRDAD